PQRLMVDDFPLRPDDRIPRAAKSPPSAVLRFTLRPARSSRVLACLARLLVSRTPRDRRHEPKARGETEKERIPMNTIAEFTIIGRVGEIRQIGSTLRVSVASSFSRRDNSGEWVERTRWNEVTVF